MRTIGYKHSGPRKDTQQECDYCGVMWLRSEMTELANGLLACPDDADGRTETELDYLRAAGAADPIGPQGGPIR